MTLELVPVEGRSVATPMTLTSANGENIRLLNNIQILCN